MQESVLITWSSWFIGFHVAKQLLEQGHTVIWIDNENDYYDVRLKQARRAILQQHDSFFFTQCNLEDFEKTQAVFEQYKPTRVLHLAAQAWVRYSIENPFCYIQTNIVWFHNVIELAKRHTVKHFMYASSASVYGGNTKHPFSVTDKTDSPLSLYGATKKSNELIAHSYHNMFGLNTTGLRFFNVYWPRGRPDGAFFIFAKNIREGKEIEVFNHGQSLRNYTYIDDVVSAVTQLLFKDYWYEIFNLGNENKVLLNYMIECIEKELNLVAKKTYLPLSNADIAESEVDISHTQECIERHPSVPIEKGVHELIQWYTDFYK